MMILYTYNKYINVFALCIKVVNCKKSKAQGHTDTVTRNVVYIPK